MVRYASVCGDCFLVVGMFGKVVPQCGCGVVENLGEVLICAGIEKVGVDIVAYHLIIYILRVAVASFGLRDVVECLQHGERSSVMAVVAYKPVCDGCLWRYGDYGRML